MKIQKIYEYALQREEEGKRFFEQNAERFGHAAVVGVFKNLALEEQKHIDFINRQLQNLDEEVSSPSPAEEGMENPNFFLKEAESELVDQTVLQSMVPVLPILRMAYLIERDFAEFYRMAADRVEGKAKQSLELLALWEKGHENLFKNLHDRAFEEYAQMPWGG
jgi:rubrerythrin